MKKLLLGSALVCAVFAAAAGPVSAMPNYGNSGPNSGNGGGTGGVDPRYNWTLTGLDSGVGTLSVMSMDNGGFDILSFTGKIDGSWVNLIGGDPGFGYATSATGQFIYDNILYSASDGPGGGSQGCAVSNGFLDCYGLLLSYRGGEANLFANTGTDYEFLNCYNGCYGGSSTGDTFSIASAPEPEAFALLGAALLALGGLGLRRKSA